MNRTFYFKSIFIFCVSIYICKYTYAEQKNIQILPGGYQIKDYLPLLKGKKVAIVGNHTSLVQNTHLLDTLLSLKINVKYIFCPEHGFRGTADAGEKVLSYIDPKTNIPVISLYGKNKKPDPNKIKEIEIILFDLQDVGVRFYTYISTLHYVMEAAAESKKKLIVLDRPNPNGMYIDGPVLDDSSCKSFVGIHPIPIIYGLTIGELAKMINGENWLGKNKKADLIVVKNKNYTHKSTYNLPTKPSPNLPNELSIALYPSLCLFEGTPISIARGTMFPFQAIGYPDSTIGKFRFVPNSIPGMAKDPVHLNITCFGFDFRPFPIEYKF